MRKILFATIAGVVILIIITLFAIFSSFRTPPETTTPQITPFPTATKAPVPQGDKIEISNIDVTNFYPDAERIDNSRNVYIVDDRERYQIMYKEQFNQFFIGILSSPFEELRLEAEQALIQELDITEEDACFLNVVITTPAFANEDYAGKSYDLSFCEQ